MNRREYADRMARQVETFGAELVRAGHATAEAASDRARGQLEKLLPQGPDTPGMAFLTAEVDGRPVGWLWIGPAAGNDGAGRADAAWIFQIWIDEPHRGNGYGRAVMLAAEQELARRGFTTAGLNVFGYNTPAIRLYESLGYEVRAQQMVKPIS